MEISPEIQIASEAPVEVPPPEVACTPESPGLGASYDIWRELLHATQGWIQYGTLGFAILCIIVAAVEALFGR
ncbi:MAG: hypothetical protein ABSB86_09570 [Bryobacteraceae bacterium]